MVKTFHLKEIRERAMSDAKILGRLAKETTSWSSVASRKLLDEAALWKKALHWEFKAANRAD